MRDRILRLHGIHNFRDYGGYAARNGARVRPGLLWRSGQHGDATPDDLEAIHRLGLQTVVDLRGDSERRSSPCARHDDFAASVLTVSGETAGDSHAPHIEVARGVKTAEEAHLAMVRLYGQLPFRPNLIAIFKLYFSAVADRDGPSLVHCLAGKDRTGVIVALLHAVLGVHQDDIMADYLLTNTAGNIERRIAAGAVAVRSNFGRDMDDDAVRTLMSVHAAYLDTAIAAIKREYASLDDYAEKVLGVDAKHRAALERRLLS